MDTSTLTDSDRALLEAVRDRLVAAPSEPSVDTERETLIEWLDTGLSDDWWNLRGDDRTMFREILTALRSPAPEPAPVPSVEAGTQERERVIRDVESDRDYLVKLYHPTGERQYLSAVVAHMSEVLTLLRAPQQKPEGMSDEDAVDLMYDYKGALVDARANSTAENIEALKVVAGRMRAALASAPPVLPAISALEELCERSGEVGDVARQLEVMGEVGPQPTAAFCFTRFGARALRDYLSSVTLPAAPEPAAVRGMSEEAAYQLASQIIARHSITEGARRILAAFNAKRTPQTGDER